MKKIERKIPDIKSCEIKCPDCGFKLIHQGGCAFCPVCGWSECNG